MPSRYPVNTKNYVIAPLLLNSNLKSNNNDYTLFLFIFTFCIFFFDKIYPI